MTAKQLQRLLDEAGLSQRGTAKAIGIGERTMRRYASGESRIPTYIAIAVACVCTHAKEHANG